MKILPFLACISMLAGSTALAEEHALSLVDKSGSGSPVENQGKVVVAVGDTDGRVTLAHQDDWTVRNVSNKPILAFVESLLIRDDHGVLFDETAIFDGFFHPRVVDLGKSVPFSRDINGVHTMDPKYRSPSVVYAEIITRWVQFEDGTTFGDPDYAKELFADRAATLEALRNLNDAYLKEGADKFADKLKNPISRWGADAYINHIRTVQQQRGTQAAVDTLQNHLKTGEARNTALNAPK